jgi:hypothetical protein
MGDKNILKLIDVMKNKIDEYNDKINNDSDLNNINNKNFKNVNDILEKLKDSFIEIKNLITYINDNNLDNIKNNINDLQIKTLLDNISKYNQELNTLYNDKFVIHTIQKEIT